MNRFELNKQWQNSQNNTPNTVNFANSGLYTDFKKNAK